jgi:hypothetical protein
MYTITVDYKGERVDVLKTNNVPLTERYLVEVTAARYDCQPKDLIISAFKVIDNEHVRFYSVRGDIILPRSFAKVGRRSW